MIRRSLVTYACVLSLNFACTRKAVHEAEDRDDETPEVAVIQLEKVELFDYLNYSGVLAARSQETLYAPLAGVLSEPAIQEGKLVKKGTKLLQIKPDSDGSEYRDHQVKASRDGTVVALLAKGGSHVDKNQELLTLADLSSFKTDLAATPEDLRFLKKDEEVKVVLTPSNKVKGFIKNIAGTPDPKTKTFTVTVHIPCDNKESCKHVVPGLLADVIVKKNPHWGFRLPFKYLRRQKSHILVVDKENTVHYVEVEVGQHYGEDVEILKGITPDTRIITSFSTMPQEGDKVKISANKDAKNDTK